MWATTPLLGETVMSKAAEQFQDLNKEAIEASLSFAEVSMAGADRLLRVQLDAAKAFVAEQAQTAKAIGDAKDAESLMSLRARVAEQAVERAVAYSRDMYEVATQTQQQLARLVAERLTSSQEQIRTAMENMLKVAPGGANPALEAVKSTMAATQSAMESFTKAAKQAAELAEANVKAVADAAASALKGANRQ